MNKVLVIGILTYLVILVTMVYGPIAAMLVEMFPTRIRYTSMSLPYHIGNGWFGGLLPTTAFAIVAQTGNMYNGLWYPIIIAGMTLVIGTCSSRKPRTWTSTPRCGSHAGAGLSRACRGRSCTRYCPGSGGCGAGSCGQLLQRTFRAGPLQGGQTAGHQNNGCVGFAWISAESGGGVRKWLRGIADPVTQDQGRSGFQSLC
jgi:hypothetical protein